MYTGHVAIAMAVRGVRNDVPLWALVAAAQGSDWMEFLVSPFTPRGTPDLYSHAFPFVLIAALAAGIAVWAWKRSAAAAATVVAVYLSHPLADFVTSSKPLWFGGPDIGLSVIGKPLVDLAVQAAVCVVGFAIYWRSLPAERRRTALAITPLALLLVLQSLSDVRLEWVRLRRHRQETQASAP